MNQKQSSNGKIILIVLLCGLLVLIVGATVMLAYKKHLDKERQAQISTVAATEEEPEEEEDEEESPYRDQLTTILGNGEDEVTVMFYFNGSNLESNYGSASTDIREMLVAPHNDNVNLVIQTTGTHQWQDFGIASDHDQRYIIQNQDLVLVDDSLGQEDCTSEEALLDFLLWTKENYPANRYMFVFWNHGGGAVTGFGYNEWGHPAHSLTIDEMQRAFEASGMDFDMIGMDCCIMSSLEVCYALYDSCDYMILSEDFESSLGWSYGGWLTQLCEDSSTSTEELGTIIIDDMVQDNNDSRMGSSSTLALIDQRYIPELYETWKEFAFANEEVLLAANYSQEVSRTGRARGLTLDAECGNRVASELGEYYITDMMALASSISSDHSKPLAAAINNAIYYYNCTDDNSGLTGLSVTLPYGSRSFYLELVDVFLAAGLDKQYVSWLNAFSTVSGEVTYYDFDDFGESWEGWDGIDTDG